MSNIETRILTRLLVSFSRPDSADGENLSAAEMLTVVDIAHEMPKANIKLVRLFENTSRIAKKLEADAGYQLSDEEKKTVMNFFQCVEKANQFQSGADTSIDFITLAGLDGITD